MADNPQQGFIRPDSISLHCYKSRNFSFLWWFSVCIMSSVICSVSCLTMCQFDSTKSVTQFEHSINCCQYLLETNELQGRRNKENTIHQILSSSFVLLACHYDIRSKLLQKFTTSLVGFFPCTFLQWNLSIFNFDPMNPKRNVTCDQLADFDRHKEQWVFNRILWMSGFWRPFVHTNLQQFLEFWKYFLSIFMFRIKLEANIIIFNHISTTCQPLLFIFESFTPS